jgi:carboxyl-terminal processing protease
MKKLVALTVVLSLLFTLNACKKKDATPSIPSVPNTPNTPTATEKDLLADSVYLYSKEVYLWHSVLPSYEQFNPRQYEVSDEFTSAENVMAAITKLEPLDRYSFVTTQAESSGLSTGDNTDWGFFVKAVALDYAYPLDSVHWFVSYVYKNSNAGTAGVQRGWYINKINGTTLGYDDASINILNDIFFGTSTSATFEFVKPGGSTATANLSKAEFTANSVLFDTVYRSNDGSKKVGYFVFNQFFGATSRAELVNVFSYFQQQGINELIVDLRNNRGGVTETQDTLADLIAPQSANNQMMYQYLFNDSLQANKFPLLRKKYGFPLGSFDPQNNIVKYEKAGSLNLSRVFFIVTGSTASASELLINNLRPYMDVKLIGDTTYGKPVGFFPIDIYNYSIYPISFKTVNSVGSADYYSGFAPDKLTPDGADKNWGDLEEPSLATALNYIVTGSFGRRTGATDEQNRNMLLQQKQFAPLSNKLSNKKFTGMFPERKK